jgi:hypothetical protein
MATILVNGTNIVINGVTGNAADKQGVASIKVPVVVPTLVAAIALANAPAAVLQAMGLSTGLTCMDRPFRELEDGQFQIDFAFEGFTHSQSWQQAQGMVQYRFDLEMENAPIQSNPNFDTAQSLYGWDSSAQAFPQTAPQNTQGNGYKVNQSSSGDSPAFGCVDWLRVGGMLSISYACDSVPAAVYQGVGTVFTSPPPGAAVLNIPTLPGKFWLKMAPDIDKHTNAIRVTEKVRLCTGDPAFAEVIYAQGQLGS